MIDYNYADELLAEGASKLLLLTDGTVTVSGTSYSVAGASVTITNTELEAEQFNLQQSLCSEAQIHYGACESGCITFTMHENIATVKGKTLKAYIIPNNDASKMLQIGVFKVAEDELSSDRTQRVITAYDAMYDILNADVAAWYNSVLPNSSSSLTLAQFRAFFLTHFGITAESVTLANDTITIKRTIEPETLSGADVIRAICEINGVFGTITNEGKFRFVELSPGLDDGLFPSDTLYPADDLYPQDVNHDVTIVQRSSYIDVQFEDYLSESITQLTIRTDNEDVGVTVGTSGNTYVITGNFLVYGYNATDLTTVATNTLAKLVNRYYRPATVNAIGNPLHEVGDGLRIRTTYRGIVTYMLERKLSGIQALRDTYTAQGEQYFGEQLNSISSQFKQLTGKTLKIKADVDGVSAELTKQLDNTVVGSYAYMTEQEIGLKVSKENIVGDLNDKMTSSITITPNNITFNSNTLIVNGTNFSLDSSGNATFKGTVDAATITGGTISGSAISGGTISGTNISGSTITSQGTTNETIIGTGIITIKPLGVSTKWLELNSYGVAINNTGNGKTVGMSEDGVSVYSGSSYTSISASQITIGNSQSRADVTVDNSGNILVNSNSVLTSNSTVSPSQIGVFNNSNQITCASFAQLKFHSNYSGTDVTLKQILDACGL